MLMGIYREKVEKSPKNRGKPKVNLRVYKQQPRGLRAPRASMRGITPYIIPQQKGVSP